MTSKNASPIAARLPRWVPLALAGLLLTAWAFGATGVQAQVQIEQIESTTSQIEGVTQSQLIIETGEAVSEDEVTGLVPMQVPDLQDADGNSAVIFQEGSGNDATVEQIGTGNEASVTQLGTGNAIEIMQKGDPGGITEDTPVSDALSTAATVTAGGLNNLAVVVQNGSGNVTNVAQLGESNVAGIRLPGSNNQMDLVQAGDGNRYLLDAPEGGSINGLDREVIQVGNGNSLTQTGGMPLNVRMRGDGMRMIIRHGAN